MTGGDGKLRLLKACGDGHVGEHGYGVQFRVVGSTGRRYVPWCDCGWTGVPRDDEGAAVAEAFHHATGRWPDIDTAPARRARPPSADAPALFDGAAYEKPRWR